MKVIASLLPNPGIDVWESLGRDAAKSDFESVYRTVIKEGDPAASLESLARAWHLRHDTGTFKVTLFQPGTARIDLSGYSLSADEIFRSITGTIWQALNMAGAQDIETTRTLCPSRGDALCRWEVSWKT